MQVEIIGSVKEDKSKFKVGNISLVSLDTGGVS